MNAFRGEFDFPFFDGQQGYEMIPAGTCLRFRSGDLAKLQAELAPADFSQISLAVARRDARTIFAALKHGLKQAGGDEPFRITESQLQDLPFAIGTVCGVIDDAFTWAWSGKTRAELAAYLAELEAKATGDGADTEALDDPDGEAGAAEGPFEDSTTL